MEQPTEFELMLRKFNRTVENSPSPSSVKDTLTKLREYAINTKSLTERQMSAITSRVDNYLSNNWGVNKKKSEYDRVACDWFRLAARATTTTGPTQP